MQFGGLYLRRHRKIRRIKAGVSAMPSGFRSAEDLPYTYNDPSPADLERQGMQKEMNGVKVELEDLKGLLGNLIAQRDESRQQAARREQGGSNRTWLWGEGLKGLRRSGDQQQQASSRLKFDSSTKSVYDGMRISRDDGSSGYGSGLSVVSWNKKKQRFKLRPSRSQSWWGLERFTQSNKQQSSATAEVAIVNCRRSHSLEARPESDAQQQQHYDQQQQQQQQQEADLEQQWPV